MILLLGGQGYVGSAIQKNLIARDVPFHVVSRSSTDYSRLDVLIKLLQNTQPEFLINAAGYTGKPNVDACEVHRAECLAGNAVLPGVIRAACEQTKTPWGHVSSGCIFTGSKPHGAGFAELDARVEAASQRAPARPVSTRKQRHA